MVTEILKVRMARMGPRRFWDKRLAATAEQSRSFVGLHNSHKLGFLKAGGGANLHPNT